MAIGERILRLRRERGLSRQDIAKKCGFSLYSLWRWETGRQSPRLDELEQLSSVLNVPLEGIVKS